MKASWRPGLWVHLASMPGSGQQWSAAWPPGKTPPRDGHHVTAPLLMAISLRPAAAQSWVRASPLHHRDGRSASSRPHREPGEQGPDRKAVWTRSCPELLMKVVGVPGGERRTVSWSSTRVGQMRGRGSFWAPERPPASFTSPGEAGWCRG